MIARRVFERYLRARWHRGKLEVVRFLLRTFAFEKVRSHHGPVLCGSPNDFTTVLALSGAYGRLLSDHIRQMQPDATFIDIGASYGLFTILASQRLIHGHVLAFEPNPGVYGRLVEALRLNHAGNVTAVNAAVGPASGLMKLQCNETHSGMAKLADSARNSAYGLIDVTVINPADSDLFRQASTANTVHIKLDVEGYEFEIIRALRQAPWYAKVRSLVVEIDDLYLRACGSGARDIYVTLQDDGFTPQRGIDTQKHYDEIFRR